MAGDGGWNGSGSEEWTTSNEQFPWCDLSLDLQRAVMRFLRLRDLYLLAEVCPSREVRDEIEVRVSDMQQLRGYWIDAKGEGRNLRWYRSRIHRVGCNPRQFSRLSKLVLSGIQLEVLPKSIGELSNLQALFLDSNRLESLPAELEECREMRVIDLMENNFKVFPSVLLKLCKLVYISLSLNPELKDLPRDILERLPDLRGLATRDCSFVRIPDALVELFDKSSVFVVPS